jgi:SpoVK/Ycf46/Vps4 family AAA+-type ATPase
MSDKLISYFDNNFNKNINVYNIGIDPNKTKLTRDKYKRYLKNKFDSYENEYKYIKSCYEFKHKNQYKNEDKLKTNTPITTNTPNTPNKPHSPSFYHTHKKTELDNDIYKYSTFYNPLCQLPKFNNINADKNNILYNTFDFNSFNFEKQLRDIILIPYISHSIKSKTLKTDEEIPIVEDKDIDVDINSLKDLIDMIENNPLVDNINYNIDMKSMNEIKPHLIELNNMIGMKELKDNVIEQIIYFSQGLHVSPNKNEGDFMHTVIYGPPGTGKTEVAKILGNIYSKLGILKNNIFRKVTRADLIAGYLGQTAIKTKDVITSCIGGVLFIDEAYSLGNEEKRDSFSKECIDTLCESLSDNKDKLMVIIAGYEKELDNCFFNLNQGLNSRFPWRFKIDKYTSEELKDIFVNKIKRNGWSLEKNDIIDTKWFEKHIHYFKYYGRDMETLFAKTKIAHAKRVFCKPKSNKKILNFEDINKGFKMFISNDEVTKRIKDNIELDVSKRYIYL